VKIRTTAFALFKITIALLYLTGCWSGSFGNVNLATCSSSTISITPKPVAVPVGTSVTFAATTSSDITGVPTWVLEIPSGAAVGASGTFGTLNPPAGSKATSVVYTAPATPPIDGSVIAAQEGEVWVQAYSLISPLCGDAIDVANFIITAPTETVGLSPVAALVALGGTQSFAGYAVGNVNNALAWQVNGVTGGSTAYGTITNANTSTNNGGLYTAPAIMPMTGATVTITMISQADPTKTQTAVVTLH
jgi:hypothetical protein